MKGNLDLCRGHEPSRDAGARMLRGALAGLALSGAYAFVCWLLVAASGGM